MNDTQSGRIPLYGERMKAYNVTLDADSVAMLRGLGDGNLAAGIRAAARYIRMHDDPIAWSLNCGDPDCWLCNPPSETAGTCLHCGAPVDDVRPGRTQCTKCGDGA